MKISRFALICICITALTAPAWSQPARPGGSPRGIPGFLNPRTGAFMPIRVATEDNAETPIGDPVTGTFKVSLTITIKSSIPSSTSILCEAEATTSDPANPYVQDEANLVASRSGATATCNLTIPYSWRLSTPSSDVVDLSYYIKIESASLSRYSYQYIAILNAVPANGTTTSESLSATI